MNATSPTPLPRNPGHSLAIRTKDCLAGAAGWPAILLMAIGSACHAAEPARPIRESVTLPVESQVAKTLFTVDEYLSEQRYDELTDLLTRLAETHSREVVAVPGETDPQANRYVNVARYCQRLLAGLPPAGRAACRKRLDPQARRLWDAWLATREKSHLERILNSAYISSVGDEALWALAESAWDRGDFSLADSYWQQLDPAIDAAQTDGLHYPDPDFPPPEIRARRILCLIFSRQFLAAERELEAFRQQYPEAVGTLAGRDGTLASRLTEILDEAKSWKSLEPFPAMSTFGGSSERQRQWPLKLDLGPLRWSKAWSVRRLPQVQGKAMLDPGPLKLFPVTDGERVFACDGDAIRAWNLLTGEPAWPNDRPDPSVIYPAVSDDRVSLPFRPCVGVAWQTLTIHQGTLLARLGSPVTGPAQIERGDLVSEVVCLDLRAGQGKLLWKLTEEDISPDGPPWSFEGTPIVVDATAYTVLYRRQPEPEYALLAVDAESGIVQWQRIIGAARPAVEDAVNRVSHLLLTGGHGRLYLSTDQGVILALSPRDGRLLWAVSYESQSPEPLQGLPAHLQSGLLPPVFWNGRVLVAPNDSQFLFCLEAASGRILWKRRSPERLRHLIGIADHGSFARLIASGNSLWAFDLEDGGLGWRMTQTDPEVRGYGQGLLTGGSLFWPTREWLYQLDQKSGQLQRKIPLRTPDDAHYGGNLAVANGLLIVAEPNRISVYGEYSRLKDRLEIELSLRPDDPVPWQQLMNLEASADHWDAAVHAGRRAWNLAPKLIEPAKTELQSQWAALLRAQAIRATEAGELDGADRFYRELSELSLSVEEQGRLLRDRSQLDIQRGLMSEAVLRLHESLACFHTSRFEIEDQPANLVIRQDLEQLLGQHGREPFRAIDQRAEQEFAAAVSGGDVRALRLTIRNYPLWESASEAWPRLIDDAVRRKSWPAVWSLLEEWQTTARTDSQRRVVQQQRIRALKAAGYALSAARRTQSFSNGDSSLSSTERHVSPWHYLERSWQTAVAMPDRLVVPQGAPPAPELACVLLSGTTIAAWDRRAGTERWRQPTSDAPVWAGYGETHLLLASPAALSARQLETGELLWSVPWEPAQGRLSFSQDSIRHYLDRLMRFDDRRGVTAFSPTTGDVLWSFRPPRGKLQPVWHCDAQRLLVQTLDPAEFWIVETATGTLRKSAVATENPWRFPPLPFGEDQYGFVTINHLVSAWGPNRTDRWTYRGAISQAHAAPCWLCDGDRLGLVIDGSTLVGVDPATGRRLWGTGLADRPLSAPERQIAVSEGLVAAACQATLRAVALADGQIVWEQLLPPDVESWRISSWGDAFAVTGTASSPPGQARLLLFRASDGRPQQMLRHSFATTDGDWHLDEQGVLFTSPQALTAWEPLSSPNPPMPSTDQRR